MIQAFIRKARQIFEANGRAKGPSTLRSSSALRRQRSSRYRQPASETLEERIVLATYSWQGGFASNVWQDGRNWMNVDLGATNQGFPDADDTAIIAGGPNLTLNADLTIGTLNWESTAPNLQLNTSVSTLTINGGTIEGGLLLGGFINNGTLNIDVPVGVNSVGDGAPRLWGSLTNNGTFRLQNGPFITSWPTAATGAITNSASGVIELVNDSAIRSDWGQPVLVNHGVIRKTGTGINATISSRIQSQTGSRIEVDGGTLNLGGTQQDLLGDIEVSPSASLQTSASVQILDDILLTGGGEWRHSAGIMYPNGHTLNSVATTLRLEALSGNGSSTQIAGSGVFNLSELKVVRGRIGTPGQFTSYTFNPFVNTGVVKFEPAEHTSAVMSAATIHNQGSIIIDASTAGSGFGLQGSAIDNQTGGTVTFLSSVNANIPSAWINGVGPSYLFNSGTLISNTPGASAFWDGLLLQNSPEGRIEVTAGTLDFSGLRHWSSTPSEQSFSKGGHFVVSPGATLDLSNGSVAAGSPRYSGRYTAEGGGTIRLGGNWWDNAVIDFPTGMAIWDAGTNYGRLINEGDLRIGPDSGSRHMWGELINEGTLAVQNGTQLQLNQLFQGQGTLINRSSGTVTLEDGSQVLGVFNGSAQVSQSPLFVNQGLVRMDGGGAWIQTRFENQGVVSVDNSAFLTVSAPRGETAFGSGVTTLPGDWHIVDGSRIDFPSAGSVFTTLGGELLLDGAGSQFTGLEELTTVRGHFALTGGANWTRNGAFENQGAITLGSNSTLTVNGAFAQGSAGSLTTLVGGTTSMGRLNSTNTTTLEGTLITGLENGFQPLETDRFDVITASAINGTFDDIEINGLAATVTSNKVTLGLSSIAADLTIENVQLLGVSGPLNPGQTFQVQYTVRNLSDRTVNGPWTDLLFLSENSTLDLHDLSVKRSAPTASLPAFGSTTITETVTVPNRPGRWFVIPAADAAGVVLDLNRSNNARPSTSAIQIAAEALPFGVNVISNAPTNEPVYYEMTVPTGATTIQVMTTFPAGDAGEIRIRRASLPTGGSDDPYVASAIVEGGNRVARITMNEPVAGTYYVSVISRAPGNAVTRADNLSLSLLGIENETSISSQLLVADSLSLTVRGTGFTSATQFRLGTQLASSVNIVDSTTAAITFSNLSIGGPFQISANNGGSPVVYSGKTFTVVSGGTSAADAWARMPNWQIEVSMPEITRPFRDIPVLVTVRNNSTRSQPAPVIQLITDNGAFLTVGETEASEDFASILAVKESGRADNYAPGETVTLRLFVQPRANGLHVFTRVAAAAIAETKIQPQTGVGGAVFPVESQEPLTTAMLDAYRTDFISTEAWTNAVRPALSALVGNTVQSWSNAIRSAAAVLAQDGLSTLNPSRAMAYLIQQANRFGTIHQRFALTAYGRGIENPLDIRAVTDADGNVDLITGFSIRSFRRSGSNFVGYGSDRGQLSSRSGGGYILTEADGTITAYSADGTWDYTESSLGVRVTAGYTAGRLTTLTDHFGDVTTYAYNGNGRITSITDPVGRAKTFAYDAQQRLTSITSVEGVITYEWNADTTGPKAWTLSGIIGIDGVRSNFVYDSVGRIQQTSLANNLQAVNYVYGGLSQLGRVTVTDALGRTTSWLEGEFGQPTAVTEMTGETADLMFDNEGRLTGVRQGSIRTSLGRDAFGNITRVTSPEGHDTTIDFDSDGVFSEGITNANGYLTDFVRNNRNLMTSSVNPDGSYRLYGYDSLGNRLLQKTEGNRWTLDTVNSKNLITRREYSDGLRQDYTYDARRNMTQIVETLSNGSTQTVTFTYDAADRITRITYPNGRFVNYRYDAGGRQDQISTSDGLTIDYTFDTVGNLATVSRNGSLQVTYTYNAAGQLASKTFGNGASTHYSYNSFNQLTRIEHRDNASAVIGFNNYAHDSHNRLISMTDAAGLTSYEYDPDGQLVAVTLPNGTIHRYDTDAVGNRTGYLANSMNQYQTGPNGEQFEYDTDGNLISMVRADGSSLQYSYDGRNRLSSIVDGNNTWQFEYDPLGNRWAVTLNGTRTELLMDALGGIDGLNDVLAEYVSGNQTASYVIGTGLEAMISNSGTQSYYHFDVTGNTTALTAGDGSVSASYRYLPFGEILSASGTAASTNRYTFNGQWGISQRGTAGFEMRARLYDSTTGRFTQLDPIGFLGGDVNLYRYVGNSPILLTDPSGLQPSGMPNIKLPSRPGGARVVQTGVGILRGAPTGSGSTGLIRTGFQTAFRIGVGQGVTIAEGGAGAAGIASSLYLLPLLPLIPVAADIAGNQIEAHEAGKAGPAPTVTSDHVRRLTDIRSKQHPALKSLLDQWRQQNPGQEPPWETVLYYLRLIKQGEKDLETSEQRTPFDPNEIVGPTGTGNAGFLTTPALFPYTIYFQNVPTAAAPAQEVFVTQQLDADLNWDSFELNQFGWGNVVQNVPAGLKSWTGRVSDPASGLVVEVTPLFNSVTGQLSWTFRSLDPVTFDLPWDGLAGFLPPDDVTGRGQGFVSYTIAPKSNAVSGTEYTGQASIVFDTEAPIITNTWLNTVDLNRPSSSVAALPYPVTTPTYNVTWSGNDGSGSGIAAYDVYVSENGGPFTIWQSQTTATSAVFTGRHGRTYQFYSVAVDHVGNEELLPNQPDTTTWFNLPSGFTAPGASANTLTPTFQWTPTPGAVSYELWFANSTTGVNPYRQATATTNSYTPATPFDIGRYAVWRRSVDANGVRSEWSPQYNVKIGAPVAVQPMDRFYGDSTPTIQWAALAGAASYELWVDNITTGQRKFVYESAWTQTSWTAATNWPMGTYRIWVRGRDAGGVTTPWLNMTEILIVAPPSATGPASATFNRRPTLTWTGVTGAQTYEVRLVNEVNGVVTTQTGLTTTNWTPPANLADGPYRWQVLAQSPAGLRSLWSTAQPLFIGGRPTVTVPSGVSGNQPTITWTPVGGAVRYELWIDRVGVQSGYLQRNQLTGTSFTPASPLPTGTYRVWLRAVSSTGEISPWSIARDVVVAEADFHSLPSQLLDDESDVQGDADFRAAADGFLLTSIKTSVHNIQRTTPEPEPEADPNTNPNTDSNSDWLETPFVIDEVMGIVAVEGLGDHEAQRFAMGTLCQVNPGRAVVSDRVSGTTHTQP